MGCRLFSKVISLGFRTPEKVVAVFQEQLYERRSTRSLRSQSTTSSASYQYLYDDSGKDGRPLDPCDISNLLAVGTGVVDWYAKPEDATWYAHPSVYGAKLTIVRTAYPACDRKSTPTAKERHSRPASQVGTEVYAQLSRCLHT